MTRAPDTDVVASPSAGDVDVEIPLWRRPWVVGLGIWCLLVGVVGWHARDLLTAAIHDWGDAAVNSILIDQAKDVRLLVGNYSRLGFNHPGPAFLYVQALGEWVLFDVTGLVASPYGAHRLTAVMLGSGFVAMAGAIVSAHTQRILPAVVLATTALAYSALVPTPFTSTWMPDLYVWPFLLMVVAAASVLAGRVQSLWMFVLAASFLIHGHVSFVLTVGAVTLVVAASLFRRSRHDGRWPVTSSVTWASAGILALFLLPMVLHLVVNWPGEIQKYLEYTGSDSAGGHRFVDVVSYVKDYWIGGPLAALFVAMAVAALVAIVVAWRSLPSRGFVLATLAMVGLVSVCTLAYAMTGVDALEQRYIARYYVAAPILTITCAAIVVVDWCATRVRSGWVVAAVAATGALIWVATLQRLDGGMVDASWVVEVTESLGDDVEGGVAVSFPAGSWPDAAALVEALRREGTSVCVVADRDSIWSVLFTEELICDDADPAHELAIEVLAGDADAEPGDIVAGSVIVRAHPG